MVKNTKEESGKCKTTIQIDGEQVFISNNYEWKHPNSNKTEFGVSAGSDYNDRGLKASIKNVKITSYE